MHSREQKAALERLAADLRRIRTQADKTLTEIHEDTRIPLEVLRRFEKDLLSGDSMFNDVYLRSILRGYARTVNHDEASILQAFEDAAAGTYDGHLGVAEPEAATPTTSGPKKKTKKERRQKKKQETSGDQGPATDKSTSSKDRPPVPNESKSEESPELKQTRKRKGFIIPGFDFRKGGVGILVLLAVATGIYGVNRILSPDSKTMASVTSTDDSASGSTLIPGAPGGAAENKADTISDPDSTDDAAAVPFVFPDTVAVSITTLSGVFDPIRVRVDRDLRRPYWADEGDTLTFTFTSRIIFEEQADRLKLLVLGKEYPLPRTRSSFTLTREMAEEFVTGSI